MTDLRKLAEGRQCMIRLPGCDGGGETSVLAHYRMPGTGMGRKPPDLCGAWACANCHDIVDGRKQSEVEAIPRKLIHAQGCLRTLAALAEEGYTLELLTKS